MLFAGERALVLGTDRAAANQVPALASGPDALSKIFTILC